MQFQTVLKARVPQVECPEHRVRQVDMPWAEKGSHFTLLFERFAIDVLLATQTVKSAMADLAADRQGRHVVGMAQLLLVASV